MENEAKVDDIEKRFKEVEENLNDQKLEQIEKRIDAAHKYPNFIIGALTVIIIAVGLFSAFNLESERKRLRELEADTRDAIKVVSKEIESDIKSTREELKNEIRSSFERGLKLPDVVLLSDINQPLEGQTVIVKTAPPTKEGKKLRILIPVIFKNQGKGSSEPLFSKIYTTKDLKFGSQSSDEKDFDYEDYWPPEKYPFQPAVLPAGVSTVLNAGFNIGDYNEKVEKFPMLIKVYFGGESSNQAKFYIKIPTK